jgi:hypothetical protein
MRLFHFIYWITVSASLLPIISYLLFPHSLAGFSKAIRKGLIWFFVYLVMHHVACIILEYWIRDSEPAVHFSVLFEFYILLYLFHGIRPIKYIRFIAWLGVIPFLLDLFWTSTLMNECIVSTVVYASTSIYFSYKIIYEKGFEGKENIFSISLLLYFLCCLTYSVFYHFIIENRVLPVLMLIHIFFYAAMSWGVIHSNRKNLSMETS